MISNISALVYLIVFFILGHPIAGWIILIIVLITIPLAIFIAKTPLNLSVTQRLFSIAQVSTGGAVCVQLGLAYVMGGLSAPNNIWFATIPILGVFSGGILTGIIWSSVCALGATVLYLLEISNYVFPTHPLNEAQFRLLRLTGTTGLIFFILGFAAVYEMLIKTLLAEIQEKKEQSEKLLHNILPKSIANRLKSDSQIIADGFESTTILFSDIVGFTSYSETISPEKLVYLLNQIFSLFDNIMSKYGLEKIKTIGDAYMVAGGLPVPREDHAEAIADMALEMLEGLKKFNIENKHVFNMRIGIHSGSVVAGVIGVKKFIYDVWGDTVNTASRMESHGIMGEIQVSETTYNLLKDKYIFKERGIINIRGKGEMKTYLMQGKRYDVVTSPHSASLHTGSTNQVKKS